MREEERLILEKMRNLPPERFQQVLDFIEFLGYQEREKEWIGFDLWVMNLAKERDFHHLTEKEVA